MASQAAIIQELFNRIGSLPPDKAAIVQELAKRFNVAPDAGAQMRADALAKAGAMMGDTSTLVPSHPYGGAPLIATNPQAALQAVPPSLQAPASIVLGPQLGASSVIDGAAQIAGADSSDAVAGGTSKILRGGMQILSPTLGAAVVAAPVATAAGLIAGHYSGKGTRAVFKAAGASDNVADLGEDIGGIAGGGVAAHYAGAGVQAVQDVGFPYMIPSDSPSLASVAGGLGGAVAGLPGAVLGALPRPGFRTQLDPAEAAAVQYGHANGVQMPTSVLTGSKVAANAENIAQNLPVMSSVAKDARAAEKSTIAAAGANEVQRLGANYDPDNPAPVPSKHTAIEGIQKQTLEDEKTHDARANDSYGLLRSIEDQPQFKATLQTGTRRVDVGLDESGNPSYKTVPVMEDVQLPVDYRGLKKAVKPLLAETLRPMSIAQEQSSTGIKAMRNILDAPDFVPASVADQDLGALKAIMRDSPQSRSVGQAAFAADLLSKQVDAAVARAGPDAVAALKQGRASTVAKYNAQDFQKAIGFKNVGTGSLELPEPVALANKLTAPGDQNINLLKRVAEETPEHIPALAQAHIQDLLDMATADAGMSKEKTALTKYNAQGPQTKAILYGDNAGRLGNFFTLNKRLAENPNPSGSAQVAALGTFGTTAVGLIIHNPAVGVPGAAAYFIGAKPLARMLFNPQSSRLMLAAMKTPAEGAGARLLGRELLKSAGADAVPVSAGTGGTLAAGGSPVATSGNGNSGSGTAGAGAPVSSEPGSGAAAGAGAAGTGGAAKRSRFTTIEIPGKPGQGYQAEYKIVDLDDVQASHSGITFQPNPKSKAKNVRDYEDPLNQGKVVNWSTREGFVPEYHTQPSVTALDGPPVDDARGDTVAGHGRTMIQQRVYAGNPYGAKAFRDSIAAEASAIEGLNPRDAYSMKRPSLRRVISDEEFARHGPNARANLVADTNVTGTASLTRAERAIEDSRRVSPETLEHVAAKLDEHGEDATLAKVLEGKSGIDILDKLTHDGVIAPQERATFEAEDGLTPAAKDRISGLMLGRFFKDPAQLQELAPSVRNKLARIAAPLAQIEGRPEWNLTPDVRNALDMIGKMDGLGIKNVDDFVKQDGLFGSQVHSEKTITLAKSIRGMGQRALEHAVKQYAQDSVYAAKGANTLMGDAPTPESAFADAFPQEKPAANALAPRDKSAEDAAIARRKETQGGFLRVSLASSADESGAGGGGGAPANYKNTPKVSTLDDVKAIMRDARNQELFVRSSSGPKFDMSNPRSMDYQTMTYHDGLSAVRIDPSWLDEDRGHGGYALKRITEYANRPAIKGVPQKLWIYEGEQVGTDSDGYESIKPKRVVGVLNPDLVANRELHFTEGRIYDAELRLQRITDPIAREITLKALAEYERELTKLRATQPAPKNAPAPKKK